MRSVVTGGAGFIGSHLCRRLCAEGHEVLVIDDLSSGAGRVALIEDAGAKLETMDITSPGGPELALSFEPDVIFHLAAQMDVRRSVADPLLDARVNILGTIGLLEAVKSAGVKFVSTSSGGCIYGEPDPKVLPIGEQTAARPTSPYGISKKVTGDYLHFYEQTYGLSYANLALANVYGPRQDPHGEAGVVAIFGRRLLDGHSCTIYGDGSQTRDFVYVDDVVDAYMAAVNKVPAGLYNIGTGIETSVLKLYELIAGLCGVTGAPVHAPGRHGELKRSALDSSKAERDLAWRPKTDLSEGLRATVDWMRTAER